MIVVGAGFSGLSTADALREKGLSVIVLEARERVGGRVEAMAFTDGTRIDTGGQFICNEMPSVVALVRQLGLGLVETHVDGDFLIEPTDSSHAGSRAGSQRLRARARAIVPDNPQIAGMTAAAWLARQPDDTAAKIAFQSTVEGLWCRSVQEVPLWYVVSNDRRSDANGNELQYFPSGTMHGVAEAFAATLGDRVRLGEPVEAVICDDEGVIVVTDTGARYRGRQVVLSVPPVAAGRIAQHPPLPEPLSTALGVWKSGMVIKVILRFARPFWRDRGLSGMVMWRDVTGLFACDASRDDVAALVIFAGGPLALDWSEKGAVFIEEDIRRRLVEAFGHEAAENTDFILRDWVNDRWSGGGYSDVITDLAAYSAEDILRAGAPPIHFASSELSSSFPAYVEGAIVAGREVAERVIAAIGEIDLDR